MANYVTILRASNECIDYLSGNPDAVEPFEEGSQKANSDIDFDGKVPSSWPSSTPVPIGPQNCNQNNTALYHWILNKTGDNVEGSGTLFQTWSGEDHNAIELAEMESYAFRAEQVPALLKLVEQVDLASAFTCYKDWLAYMEDDYVPTDENEAEELAQEFKDFAKELKIVTEAKDGIIWTA